MNIVIYFCGVFWHQETRNWHYRDNRLALCPVEGLATLEKTLALYDCMKLVTTQLAALALNNTQSRPNQTSCCLLEETEKIASSGTDDCL